MSGLNPEPGVSPSAGDSFGATIPPASAPGPSADPGQRDLVHDKLLPGLRDAGIVAAWFVVAGILGAVVWWQLTPLAEFTRTVDNGVMDEQQLAKQVATDGWFVVISAIGGLVSGIALLSWRRRDPVLMVVLLALGGGLATWVMLQAGLALGPPDPSGVLPHAKTGAKIPIRLDPTATGIYVTWSVTALLGAIGVIWGTDGVARRQRDEHSE
jgi:hypothetical protein